jgi:hypothetical protein
VSSSVNLEKIMKLRIPTNAGDRNSDHSMTELSQLTRKNTTHDFNFRL